ncbi:MAG: hypothetical protein IPN17_23305 [Deltaproteobacteria bacterium]|nr:hypothetical protein [Deltaproteobacteria bacterium]
MARPRHGGARRRGGGESDGDAAGVSDAPFWERSRTNCDEAGDRRATLRGRRRDAHSLGDGGRGDSLVAAVPVPMRIRPSSNYHWRSDPYRPNGSGSLAPCCRGVDLRMAYWMGRYLRVSTPSR